MREIISWADTLDNGDISQLCFVGGAFLYFAVHLAVYFLGRIL